MAVATATLRRKIATMQALQRGSRLLGIAWILISSVHILRSMLLFRSTATGWFHAVETISFPAMVVILDIQILVWAETIKEMEEAEAVVPRLLRWTYRAALGTEFLFNYSSMWASRPPATIQAEYLSFALCVVWAFMVTASIVSSSLIIATLRVVIGPVIDELAKRTRMPAPKTDPVSAGNRPESQAPLSPEPVVPPENTAPESHKGTVWDRLGMSADHAKSWLVGRGISTVEAALQLLRPHLATRPDISEEEITSALKTILPAHQDGRNGKSELRSTDIPAILALLDREQIQEIRNGRHMNQLCGWTGNDTGLNAIAELVSRGHLEMIDPARPRAGYRRVAAATSSDALSAGA